MHGSVELYFPNFGEKGQGLTTSFFAHQNWLANKVLIFQYKNKEKRRGLTCFTQMYSANNFIYLSNLYSIY